MPFFPRKGRYFPGVNLVKARFISLLGAALVLFSGCNEKNQAPVPTAEQNARDLAAQSAPPPSGPGSGAAGQPQAKLRTVKLWLGSHEIIAEVAMTPQEVQTGMMFRTSIGEKEGMLFVFRTPHRASFWMKNTLVPLSCAYIDSEGIIVETHDMFPNVETPITAGSDKIQYVLELKQGWFQRNNVAPGALIRSEKGTLRETFFR